MKSKTTYVRILHFVLLFSTLILTKTTSSQILLQTSFEGSNPWTGVSNSQACCSYSVTASTAQAHDGNQSFRAEVRATDPAVSSGYRAELTTPSVTDDGDMWYGWSMYFEKNGTGNWNPGCCGHMVQWHPENSNGSASLSLWYTTQGGSAVWDVATNPSGGQGVTHQTTRYDGGALRPIVANQWHDVVFHCNWTTGVIEFYLNGELYFRKTGLNYAGGPGQYFKLGMNRWTMTNTWVIYYDNLKIGRNVTYADVAPATAPPVNMPPIVNAGNDISIVLPVALVTLNGTASDPDGTIASRSWSKVSGPASFTISTPGNLITTVLGLVQGTYVFRLTATDDQGATTTDDVSVTVLPLLNSPPNANAGQDISITLPTNNTTLNGSGTDSDGTIASYAWSRVSGPTTFNIVNPSSASTALTNLVQGTYVFRLTVTDNSGATDSDNVTVVVNAASNVAPTANAGNNITLTLPNNSTSLSGTGTDSDGTIASYAWSRVSGPTTFTLGSPNAANTTLSNLVQGTYVFRLTVTDDDGATATDDVSVIVNAPVNQAPNANAGNNITITLPTNSTTLSGTATDADGTIASYAWSRVSGPTSLNFGNASSAVTTVSGLVQGVYVFRLTVRDDDGATDTDDVTVTVNAAANIPPGVNAGTNISLQLPANSTTLNGAAVDADGSIATYSWSKISGPASFVIVSPSSATTAINNLVQGTYVFRLTVTDNNGASNSDDVTVTVNAATAPPNQAPHANAGSDISITLPTNSTTLNGTATDADGTITSYAWTKVSGPNTVTVVSPSTASTALNNLVQGVYVFRLTVTDNSGATDTDDITVTVNAAPPPPNQPPFANAGNNITITLPVNSTTLAGSGTDADGTVVSYAWARMSGPTTFTLANANAATTALTNLVQGTYVFRLTVTDNNGATDTDNITVTVNAPAAQPPNVAPVANAGNDVLIHVPANNASLTGTGSSDSDGSIATYAWSKVSGPTSFTINSPSSANTTLSNLVAGVYVFRLTVTDNDGASSSDNVTVTVNQPPVANAGIDIVMTLPTSSTTLNGSGSTDPDGAINTYAWTRISGPTSFTLANANGVNTSVSNLVQGQYVFRLTITDNRGASHYDEVRITVNPAPPPAPNQAPEARIANDVVLHMPVNYTELNGSESSDSDGNIVFREWNQVSGPTDAVLTNPSGAVLTVSNLVVGEYEFELTVRDNDGASSSARVKVTVKNKNNEEIYCSLYPNPAAVQINMRYIDTRMGTFALSIFDANNRFIQRKSVTKDVITFTHQIDISRLNAGVYFLQIICPDGEKVVRKFVKQ